MVQRYIFFNSALGDLRTYQASDFAEYFGSVLSTGLLHTDNVPGMSVSVETGTLNTVVSAGKAIMKGHFYDNTATTTLTHSIPEPTLNRIDRIVLRLDLRNSERNILLFVKTGVASSTPVAPVLQRDNFIYEISLAQIYVNQNTAQLLQSDLVDERLDETLCGLVYSLISIPTSQFQAEWDAFMASVQNDGFTPVATFDAHIAENATDAHNATSISVADTANKFTATNVETALLELFTFANNGKTDIASVVGSPATSGDTFTQLKTHIQTRKNELATNLSGKGQASVGTETLDTLVGKVALVSTGLKSATGTTTSNGSARLIVSGLTFKPKIVIAKGTANRFMFYWVDGFGLTTSIAGTVSDVSSVYTAATTTTSFDIGVGYLSTSYLWIAVE